MHESGSVDLTCFLILGSQLIASILKFFPQGGMLVIVERLEYLNSTIGVDAEPLTWDYSRKLLSKLRTTWNLMCIKGASQTTLQRWEHDVGVSVIAEFDFKSLFCCHRS